MRTLPSPLFKPELRQVNRDGHKTMTRRVIRGLGVFVETQTDMAPPQLDGDMWVWPDGTSAKSPHGGPDDVWYMREPLMLGMKGESLYLDDGNYAYKWDEQPIRSPQWLYKHNTLSSMYMPRWAARTFLLITDVRVERLQAMPAGDAAREGIATNPCNPDKQLRDFALLWNSINAKRGFPWESNPWVWVYAYRLATAEQEQ